MDRKDCHKFVLIGLALVLSLQMQAQNLVPNPSFEEYTECPIGSGRIVNAYPWYNARPSCDYYHECGTNGAGVPISQGGGGYARSGQAYAGFKVWCINDVSGIHREILGVELLGPLVEGETYRVELFLSMLDSVWYASKNVGVYFSVEQPYNHMDSIESYQPQVRYEGEEFLTGKEGWMQIAGTFVAQGGERFLSIGNFDRYEDTEVLFVSGGGIPPWHSAVYWSCAEYFIDDVSVVPDSITSVQEVVDLESSYKLYPNPNTGEFTLSLNMDDHSVATMTVWNISGQQVHTQQLTNGSNTINLNVAEGLYLYRVVINDTTQWTGKVSISSN